MFPPTPTKLSGGGFSFSFLKEPSFRFSLKFYYVGLSNLLIIAFIFSSKSFCFSVVNFLVTFLTLSQKLISFIFHS